jgi:hypothetical protein
MAVKNTAWILDKEVYPEQTAGTLTLFYYFYTS